MPNENVSCARRFWNHSLKAQVLLRILRRGRLYPQKLVSPLLEHGGSSVARTCTPHVRHVHGTCDGLVFDLVCAPNQSSVCSYTRLDSALSAANTGERNAPILNHSENTTYRVRLCRRPSTPPSRRYRRHGRRPLALEWLSCGADTQTHAWARFTMGARKHDSRWHG